MELPKPVTKGGKYRIVFYLTDSECLYLKRLAAHRGESVSSCVATLLFERIHQMGSGGADGRD